eukprot:Trichotokara_eunicae@DN5058_c0_g1_i4.p1
MNDGAATATLDKENKSADQFNLREDDVFAEEALTGDSEAHSGPPAVAKSRSTVDFFTGWRKLAGKSKEKPTLSGSNSHRNDYRQHKEHKEKGYTTQIRRGLLAYFQKRKYSGEPARRTDSRISRAGMNAVFLELKSKNFDLKQVPENEKRKKKTGGHGPITMPLRPVEKMPTGKDASPKSLKKPLPPRMELEHGRDWCVENFIKSGEKKFIEEGNLKQNLYMRNCDGLTLHVTPKINNIVIESCKNTNLIFSTIISSLEIIHCEKVKCQALGNLPSAVIDSSSGVTIAISAEGLEISIATSKSSEMNLVVPKKGEEEGEWDYMEVPIPEQFIHSLKPDYTLASRVSDLY